MRKSHISCTMNVDERGREIFSLRVIFEEERLLS